MFQAKASKERLDVVKSLMACKPKLGASICAFVLEIKGYFDILESLNMVFDAELSINIILSGIKKIVVPSTLAAPVLIVCHNAKKRKTSHSNWKGKDERKVRSGAWQGSAKYSEGPHRRRGRKGSHSGSKGNYPLQDRIETVECISHNGNVILNVGSFNELDKSKLWHFRLGHDRVKEKGKVSSLGTSNLGLGEVLVRREKSGQTKKGVFLEIEMISKEDSGSKIDLKEIQESVDEEPIVNTKTQPEVVTPVEPDNISLPIRRTSGRVTKPP
ncbi:hypothetical protein Tco_1134687 [Tanacetum coccineum]